MQEKGAEVMDEEGSWGKRMCEGIARLSSSLDGLTTMVEHQNAILGHLAVRMEEELDWARWRRKREGEPVMPLVVIMGVGDEEEEEGEEEAGNEGENEEDGE